jgi:hypothetical protein
MIRSGVSNSFVCEFSFSLLICSYTGFFCFPTAIFPESQERAEAAVAKFRVEDPTSAVAPWTTEDCLTALSARVNHMKKLAKLPDAAINAFQCLWPEEPVPDHVGTLASRLLESGKRLSEWRCSASRAGADTALRFVCSWYKSLDLDTLTTMRGDAPTDTDPILTAKRRVWGYRIAHYAPTSTFIPALADLEDELSEAEDENEDDEDEETEEIVPEGTATTNDETAAFGQAPVSSSPEYA